VAGKGLNMMRIESSGNSLCWDFKSHNKKKIDDQKNCKMAEEGLIAIIMI
jgi:hypothetical protein